MFDKFLEAITGENEDPAESDLTALEPADTDTGREDPDSEDKLSIKDVAESDADNLPVLHEDELEATGEDEWEETDPEDIVPPRMPVKTEETLDDPLTPGVDPRLKKLRSESVKELENPNWTDVVQALDLDESLYQDIDYAVDIAEPTDIQMGLEINVEGEDGELYAGRWIRTMIERARERPKQATWMGYRDSTKPKEVPVSHDDWFRHAAVFGTTGYGKTTVLYNMMTQWAYSGYGFCFIDPKGDGVTDVLQRIPPERKDDLIWIEPTPRDDIDRVVGLNFLEAGADRDSAEFETEVSSIIDDLESIFADDGYWGAKMGGIMTNIARGMIESEVKYTLIDMYYVLVDEEYRKMFAEDVDDELVQRYTNVIANEMDQDEFEPLIRRIREWIENRITREIVSHQESTVNIKEAVENGKIILVKNDVDSDKLQRIISTAIMRRIWSAIKARDALDEDEERTPYYLLVDEFDDVASEMSSIDKMLSKARSQGMGVTLCCQQPSQLSGGMQKAILGNCDSLFAMNPNEPDDARLIMKRFGDYTDTDLINLGKYKMFTRLSVNADRTEPFVTKTFAPYPPLRTKSEAQELIQYTLEEYGAERLNERKDHAAELALADVSRNEDGSMSYDKRDRENVRSDNTVKDSSEPQPEDEKQEEEEDTEKLPMDLVLESILAHELRADDTEEQDGFVKTQDVRVELKRRLQSKDLGYQSLTANLFEKLPEKYVKTQRRDGDVMVKLTADGKSRVFEQDTGQSGSGGGDDHRYILRRAFETLTKAGYIVELPSQEGEDIADGIADIPMDMSASSPHEAQKKLSQLQDEYPDVAGISENGRDAFIEAETKTIDWPSQTLRNLRKSLEEERRCIFAFKDKRPEGKKLQHDAEKALGFLTGDNIGTSMEKNGKVRYYSSPNNLEIEKNVYGLRPADTGRLSQWWNDGEGGAALVTKGFKPSEGPVSEENENVMLTIDDKTKLERDSNGVTDATREDLNAFYYHDRSSGNAVVTARRWVVEEYFDPDSREWTPKDHDDEWMDEDSEWMHRTYDERSDVLDDWRLLSPPFIPENALPRMPDRDDWTLAVFPDDNRDLPPLKVVPEEDENGEITGKCTMLLESDKEKYSQEEIEERLKEVNEGV